MQLPDQLSARRALRRLCKGSVDGLLAMSTPCWDHGQVQPMDEHWRARIAQANDDLARAGHARAGRGHAPARRAARHGR